MIPSLRSLFVVIGENFLCDVYFDHECDVAIKESRFLKFEFLQRRGVKEERRNLICVCLYESKMEVTSSCVYLAKKKIKSYFY